MSERVLIRGKSDLSLSPSPVLSSRLYRGEVHGFPIIECLRGKEVEEEEKARHTRGHRVGPLPGGEIASAAPHNN